MNILLQILTVKVTRQLLVFRKYYYPTECC